MGISGDPSRTVSAALTAAEKPSPGRHVVRVTMLKDGRGITSHGRRPVEVSALRGDDLEVSADLAKNWEQAGICEEYRYRPKEESTDVPTPTASRTARRMETAAPAILVKPNPKTKKGSKKRR